MGGQVGFDVSPPIPHKFAHLEETRAALFSAGTAQIRDGESISLEDLPFVENL
jgi:hypothetical protein